MDGLNYEFHLNRYKNLLSVRNEETKKGAMHNVLQEHQLAVRLELANFTSQAVAAGHKLANKKAQQYMWYGVGRRLRMILVSYSELFNTITPHRTEPLLVDELAAASRDLNIIYINIRGALDNLALCILNEKGLKEGYKLRETQTALFNWRFRNGLTLEKVRAVLNANVDWSKELKARRDPSAHRMPLYIPPATLSDAETARHQQIWKERLEAIQKGEFKRDAELENEQERLGTFRAYFLHDPDDGGYPIYPTVPTDVGKLLTIGQAVLDDLLRPSAASM